MIIDLFLWALLIILSPIIVLCGIAAVVTALMFLFAILVGIGSVILKLIDIILDGLQRKMNKNTNGKIQKHDV